MSVVCLPGSSSYQFPSDMDLDLVTVKETNLSCSCAFCSRICPETQATTTWTPQGRASSDLTLSTCSGIHPFLYHVTHCPTNCVSHSSSNQLCLSLIVQPILSITDLVIGCISLQNPSCCQLFVISLAMNMFSLLLLSEQIGDTYTIVTIHARRSAL